MGYTTEFYGEISIDPPLNSQEISFLRDFATTRRMHRNRGPLFVGGGGPYGQARDSNVINVNAPHPDQPGMWCQWVPTSDGEYLEWDGGEKFYKSPQWMKYIIENLLAPSAATYLEKHSDADPRLAAFTANHVLNGEIRAEGEESLDVWYLVVADNVVGVAKPDITYSEPEPV